MFRALFFFAPVCSFSRGCSLSWLHFVWLCGMVAVWSIAARCQVLECSSLLSADLIFVLLFGRGGGSRRCARVLHFVFSVCVSCFL